MVKRCGIFIVLIAAIAGFTGCACEKNNRADNWGRSYELAKYNQCLNPEAGKNLEPVEGLNGAAADTVMAGYQNSFKGQKEKESYTINLGSVAGVGQAK